MRFIKFVLFFCFLLFCIVVANVIYKHKVVQNQNRIPSEFVSSNLILFNYNNEIRAIASVYFNIPFSRLAKLFEIEEDDVRNNILKKEIMIKNSKAELTVFVGNDTVEQVTINISTHIDDILENLMSKLKSHNINLELETIEDSRGKTILETYSHKTDNYKFLINKSYEMKEQHLSVDYINTKILQF